MKNKLNLVLIGIIAYYCFLNIVYIFRYAIEISVYYLSDSVILTTFSPVIIYLASFIFLFRLYKKGGKLIMFFEEKLAVFILLFLISFLLQAIFFVVYSNTVIPSILEISELDLSVQIHEKYSTLLSKSYNYLIKVLILVLLIKENLGEFRRHIPSDT